MSRNTVNLNLYCVDPVADGNNTFNIDEMLNDNWDKIDAAVASRAKLDGSTPFQGNVTVNGFLKLKGGSDKKIEFYSAQGSLEGFVGRIGSDGTYVGINNSKSAKTLQLADDGLLKYGGNEVLTSGNHHTYVPLAADGSVRVESGLPFLSGNGQTGVRFVVPNRAKASKLYWEATQTQDNGLIFEVDGNPALSVQSDGTGYLREGGQWRTIFHNANHHAYMPVNKTGDSMTGDLVLQNGDSSVLLKFGKTGRPGKNTYMFWNATAANDYGLTFVVDGNYAMKITSTGDLYAMKGVSTSYKVLHEGNHHTFTPLNKAGDIMTGNLFLSKAQLYISNTDDGDFVGYDYCQIFQEPGTLNLYVQTGGSAGSIVLNPQNGDGKAYVKKSSTLNEIFHRGNHHTYQPVAVDGSLAMTGNLVIGNNGRLVLRRVATTDQYTGIQAHNIDNSGGSGYYKILFDYFNGRWAVGDAGGNIKELFHAGNHHTYEPVNKTGDTMTGVLTLATNATSPLIIRKTTAGSASGVSEGDWNYISMMDGQGDRMGYMGISNLGDSIIGNDISGGKLMFSAQGIRYEVNHSGNHHTYEPVNKAGDTMTGKLSVSAFEIMASRTRITGFSSGFHYMTYSPTDDSDIIGGFYRRGAKDYDLRVCYAGTTRTVYHEGNHHTYIPVNKAGDTVTGALAVATKLSIGTFGAYPATGMLDICIGSNKTIALAFQETPGSSNPTFYIEADYIGTEETGNWLTMRDWVGHNIMTWRADGNVGIGTVSPAAPLHIKPSAVSGVQPGILLEDAGSGGSEGLRIAWRVSDHTGVDLAAIEGASSATGGTLKLLVNSADTGTPTEKVRIEPSLVSIKTNLDVTGTFTNNGNAFIFGTYHQSGSSTSVPKESTVRASLNISGDKDLILVSAKSSHTSVDVVLNGYRPDKLIEYNPQTGQETGTTVYCTLERNTSTNQWYVTFHNTSLYNITMTWKVLELA